MHLFIVADGVPNHSDKLNGKLMFDLAKNLQNAGITVSLLVLDLRSILKIRRFGFSSYKREEITVFKYSYPTLGRFEGYKSLSSKYQRAMGMLLDSLNRINIKPKLIHAHFLHLIYAAGYYKSDYGYKLIATEHLDFMAGDDFDDETLQLIIVAYTNSDILTVVSPALKQNIISKFSFNSEVIPNIINPIFTFNDTLKNKDKNTFNFISIAHNEKRKRLELLIEAFQLEFSASENVHLFIIGEGTKKLSKFISSSFKNKIELLGRKNPPIIKYYLDSSDAFVLPSKLETFGLVYLEALFSGLPVISTRCKGPEHFIKDHNGILIDVDSLIQLRTALRDIYINYKRYDREKISMLSISQYSTHTIINKYIEIYERLTEEKDKC